MIGNCALTLLSNPLNLPGLNLRCFKALLHATQLITTPAFTDLQRGKPASKVCDRCVIRVLLLNGESLCLGGGALKRLVLGVGDGHRMRMLGPKPVLRECDL